MSTFYTGATGSLYVSGQRVAKVVDWTLDGAVEPLEITNTGDEARYYINGLQSYSGSCTAIYWDNDSGGLAMKDLLSSIYRTNGTSPTATSQLSLRAADSRKFAVDVLFTGASASVSAGSVTNVSLQFVVNGHLQNVSFAG